MEPIEMKRTHDEQDECPVAQGSRGITATRIKIPLYTAAETHSLPSPYFPVWSDWRSIGERGAKMKKGPLISQRPFAHSKNCFLFDSIRSDRIRPKAS
jgi:hypothetical protein